LTQRKKKADPQPLPPFRARRPNQQRYHEQLNSADLVFAIGPAGTGKTYVTAHRAVAGLLEYDEDPLRGIEKYIIVRPTIAVDDEEMGYLPGSLNQKTEPWMKPVLQEVRLIAGVDRTRNWLDQQRIEFCTIAHIRGRTFSNALVHVSEAQNLSLKQAEAVLTRHGPGTRLVIEGDPDQSDRVPDERVLATLLQMAWAEDIPHAVTKFTEEDVVRSDLCRRWVKAFRALKERADLCGSAPSSCQE
jgi:phosphate starvation-inducible PhoH-like protein